MHHRKASLLRRLDEVTRRQDATMRTGLGIVSRPSQHGWVASLATAAVILPLTGVSALSADLAYVLLARSDDAVWDRLEPPDRPAAAADGTT